MIHIDPEFNLQPLILPVKSHSRLDCYQLEKSLNFLFFNILFSLFLCLCWYHNIRYAWI